MSSVSGSKVVVVVGLSLGMGMLTVVGNLLVVLDRLLHHKNRGQSNWTPIVKNNRTSAVAIVQQQFGTHHCDGCGSSALDCRRGAAGQ